MFSVLALEVILRLLNTAEEFSGRCWIARASSANAGGRALSRFHPLERAVAAVLQTVIARNDRAERTPGSRISPSPKSSLDAEDKGDRCLWVLQV